MLNTTQKTSFNKKMTAENLLLTALPREVCKQIENKMEQLELSSGEILNQPGETIEYVYFPLTCLISVTITMMDGITVEAGVVGSREMVGINAFMGGEETTQTQYIVQIPGKAVKMKAHLLLHEFDINKALRDVMLKYTQAYIAQISQNVACNRTHTIEKRMARWLLESSDRLYSDELSLSHEFLIKPKTALINVSAAFSSTEVGLALSIFVKRIWDVSMPQYWGL